MLEQETTDYLERDLYKRCKSDQEHPGYRNGISTWTWIVYKLVVQGV